MQPLLVRPGPRVRQRVFHGGSFPWQFVISTLLKSKLILQHGHNELTSRLCPGQRVCLVRFPAGNLESLRLPNLFLVHFSVAGNAFSVETDMACDSEQRIKRTIKVELWGREKGRYTIYKEKLKHSGNVI